MEHVFQSYFFHMDLKTFTPPFQDEILMMEIWKGLADVQFSPEAARIYFRQSKTCYREGEFAVTLTKGPKKRHTPLQAPGGLQDSSDPLLFAQRQFPASQVGS